MRKIKIYLDTSVISYLSQEDAPERMRDTLELWKDFMAVIVLSHGILNTL